MYEDLVTGHDIPWLNWRCMNRLRTGYTCSKEQRKKWVNYNGDTTCECGWQQRPRLTCQSSNQNTKNNNSTGTDNINIKHLKHIGKNGLKYLTNIYNAALNDNKIPVVVVYPFPCPFLVGESDVPACDPPASFSVHLASSAVAPAGSVHKSRGDNVVRMWVQLKR